MDCVTDWVDVTEVGQPPESEFVAGNLRCPQGHWDLQSETLQQHVSSADGPPTWEVADLRPFQQAMDAAIRDLAAAADMSPTVLNPDPDGPTSADVFRSHDPIQVAWRDPAVPTSRLRLGALANIPPAMLAVAASFHPAGARMVAAVERLNARLRAAFPDHSDEAIAAARHRAHTSFDTYEQAVEAVIADPEFASANAKNPQVASHPDPSRGWLSRWFDRLFGRTT